MGKFADWYAPIASSVGAWATMELFEISIARSLGRVATPLLIGTAVYGGVNTLGSIISEQVDPEHGLQNWNEYFASPLNKIHHGRDSISKNILYATATHHVSVKEGLQKLGTVHPLARLWMKNV